jgi:hypothetical protein
MTPNNGTPTNDIKRLSYDDLLAALNLCDLNIGAVTLEARKDLVVRMFMLQDEIDRRRVKTAEGRIVRVEVE